MVVAGVVVTKALFWTDIVTVFGLFVTNFANLTMTTSAATTCAQHPPFGGTLEHVSAAPTPAQAVVATFYPFSQFCEIEISPLSLQTQPKASLNLFQRGVDYGKYGNDGVPAEIGRAWFSCDADYPGG